MTLSEVRRMGIALFIIGVLLAAAAVLLCIAFYKWIQPDWCAQHFMREKYETSKSQKERAEIARETRQVFVWLASSALFFVGLLLIVIGLILIF
mgnify:CR=1 FL=1